MPALWHTQHIVSIGEITYEKMLIGTLSSPARKLSVKVVDSH